METTSLVYTYQEATDVRRLVKSFETFQEACKYAETQANAYKGRLVDFWEVVEIIEGIPYKVKLYLPEGLY